MRQRVSTSFWSATRAICRTRRSSNTLLQRYSHEISPHCRLQIANSHNRNSLTALGFHSSKPLPRTHPMSSKLSSQWPARLRNAWEPPPARTKRRSTSDRGRVCNRVLQEAAAEEISGRRWVGSRRESCLTNGHNTSSQREVLLSVMHSDHLAVYAC
jgi:hypothetical protein